MCLPDTSTLMFPTFCGRQIRCEARDLFVLFSSPGWLFFLASLTAGRALMDHSSQRCSANQRPPQHPGLAPSAKSPGLQKHMGGTPDLLTKSPLYRKSNIFILYRPYIRSIHLNYYKVIYYSLLSIGRIIHTFLIYEILLLTNFDHVCSSPK